MAVLSDGTLRGFIRSDPPEVDIIDRRGMRRDFIVVDPYPEERAFQPCSLDIRVGYTYYRKIEGINTLFVAGSREPIIIYPHEFILLSSLERFAIPNWVRGNVESKSSVARLGLENYRGHLDPGFEGDVTLEFQNVTERPLMVLTEDYIAQVLFEELDEAAIRAYGTHSLLSHYQNQSGATLSWLEGGRCDV